MPLLAMASAISRTFLSSTRPANLFQLFQPIGGVSARPLGGSGFTAASGLCVGNRSAGIAAAAETFLYTGGVPRPPRPPTPEIVSPSPLNSARIWRGRRSEEHTSEL